MSNVVFANIIRFVAILLLQGLILKRAAYGWVGPIFIHPVVYPLFFILLPLRTPRPLLLLLAFALGLGVDVFYDSWGVHAGASVFSANLRSWVLGKLEPRGGYNVNFSPTQVRMGSRWFYSYAGIMMAIHLLAYYGLDYFSPYFLGQILIKSLFSFIQSMIFIIIVMHIFKPKN